jgi:predicted dehydrogenase
MEKMAKKYRVGVAAMVHDHVWGELHHWNKMENVELVAAGDVNQDLRDKISSQFGVPRTYESWQEMIEKEELDIVQAASENNQCADIVEACAAKGIHVISEKPMAARLSQANRMLAAATKANIKLAINWPTSWIPHIQEWERRLLAGDIGNICYLKYRSAHNGPKEIGCDPHFWGWLYDEEKNGAGAFMDYICYSAMFNARILGLPKEVMGMRAVMVKDYALPDDNAVVIMKYPHAFGVSEASWTQVVGYAEGANPIAYGSEGSLSCSKGNVIWQRPGKDAEVIAPAELKYPLRSGPEYLIHCIENNEPVEGFSSPKVGRDAQEILEAGLLSADSGKHMTLPLAQ